MFSFFLLVYIYLITQTNPFLTEAYYDEFIASHIQLMVCEVNFFFSNLEPCHEYE